MDDDNIILEFREKSLVGSVYVSMGIYVFQREILRYLPERGDLERTTFVSLAKERKLRAYRHSGLWITVNTLKDLKEADRILSSQNESQ
jgi:NDP-sugar pyrophosphorylase family protein